MSDSDKLDRYTNLLALRSETYGLAYYLWCAVVTVSGPPSPPPPPHPVLPPLISRAFCIDIITGVPQERRLEGGAVTSSLSLVRDVTYGKSRFMERKG